MGDKVKTIDWNKAEDLERLWFRGNQEVLDDYDIAVIYGISNYYTPGIILARSHTLPHRYFWTLGCVHLDMDSIADKDSDWQEISYELLRELNKHNTGRKE